MLFLGCCVLFTDTLPPPPLTPADTEDRGSRSYSIDEGLHGNEYFIIVVHKTVSSILEVLSNVGCTMHIM